jgi:hypothetical protein
MATSTAILSEPRAAGDSAELKPSAVGSVPAQSAPETDASERVVSGSEILKSLSPAALKKWRLSGLLPPDVEIKEKHKKEVGENEARLAELSPEERDKWRATGNLPEKKAGETPAKDEAGSEKSNEAGETSHPLAKIEALRVGKKDVEVNALHTERQQTHNDRYQADRKRYSQADQSALAAAAMKLLPLLPKGMLEYFNATQVHLNHPFTFYKDFVLSESFRREVLTAAATGDVANVAKVMAKHDAAIAAKAREESRAREVSKAPAPAASISGRATAPVDEEGTAVKNGEFRRYMDAANRADHLKRRGMRYAEK